MVLLWTELRKLEDKFPSLFPYKCAKIDLIRQKERNTDL